MRHLRNLTLYVSPTDSLKEASEDSFPGLKMLHLTAAPQETLGVVAHFLQSMPPSILLSIDMFRADSSSSSASSLNSLLAAVAQRLVPTQLRELAVHETFQNVPGTWSMGSSDIKQLSGFMELHLLKIDTRRTVLLDEPTLLAVVKTLPKLKFLSLNPSQGWGVLKPGVTLSGLRRLVSHLPFLTHLMLAVDTQGPPDLSEFSCSHQKGLILVDLLDSRIHEDNIQTTAVFLKGLFPGLKGGAENGSHLVFKAWDVPTITYVVGPGEDGEKYRERWKHVERLMGPSLEASR
ncbi:hypothetical protein CONPUDRAFT_156543 [Coniophora puteana RWD-64-598 SS2]|uniref:F-box domain-containing protein n=1 Tax=Coniophora puteana (strain RWD-64-598) TaxID=741705 RepID=A0A5M3MIU5_CONPW|nr:uncharacterized protein CONPUDRAFT_156543 [Coniophora puteana RWD-64-598 SS2]EIW78565.1 hypothetical protein CONPUDRAFT_156543 [Coniophora puteana RWD-64-598 SS2]